MKNGSGGHVNAILKLLKDKNYNLQKFVQMNASELKNFHADNFDNLEVFYQSREAILDLVRCIDELIEQSASDESDDVASDAQKAEMLRLMAEKRDVVHQILAQDLEILSVIERAKSNIIHELRATQTSRKAVAAYRAPNLALDEEA